MGKRGFRPPVKGKPSKGIKKILDEFKVQQKDREEFRKDMNKEIHKVYKEEWSTKDETFKAMVKEHMIMKRIVMRLSGLSIDEWNKMYSEIEKEMEKKKKG